MAHRGDSNRSSSVANSTSVADNSSMADNSRVSHSTSVANSSGSTVKSMSVLGVSVSLGLPLVDPVVKDGRCL